MNLNYFIFFLATICSLSANAQFGERIISGRPGQANGARAVGAKTIQLQSGIDYNFEETTTETTKSNSENVNQNSVFRIGLVERTEFRLAYAYQISETPGDGEGLNAFNIGLRQNFFSQEGFIPTIALQGTIKLGGLDEFEQERPIYQLRLLLGHNITNRLSLNTNLTADFRPEENTIGSYVFSFAYSLTDNLSALAEVYGTYDNDSENLDVLFDAGFGYLIGNDFQLDIYGGYAKNKFNGDDPTTVSYFISAGLSFRMHNRD